MSESKNKEKNKNKTIGETMSSLKRGKWILRISMLIFVVFPFIPPYFLYYNAVYIPNLVFDPGRNPEQVTYFFVYLGLYYLIYLMVLGAVSEKHKKQEKIIIDKAILLGCPVDICPIKNSNSYQCKVLVNAEMMDFLKELHYQDKVEWQEEEIATKEPYVKKFSLGGGTSEKFLSKNIPFYEKARKIGLPESLVEEKHEPEKKHSKDKRSKKERQQQEGKQ
ncbi:MAG: hypothetical protein R3Y63_05290 [Eubacteriales bacterium]